MHAYYRKEQSRKVGKVSWGTFRNAKRCAGLKKYIVRQRRSV